MDFCTGQVSTFTEREASLALTHYFSSYFWSAEFWGGMRCTQIMSRKQRWRRRGFVALVLIGGSLALLAGPATALLMIPRSQDWPVGGGIFWLNGED